MPQVDGRHQLLRHRSPHNLPVIEVSEFLPRRHDKFQIILSVFLECDRCLLRMQTDPVLCEIRCPLVVKLNHVPFLLTAT